MIQSVKNLLDPIAGSIVDAYFSGTRISPSFFVAGFPKCGTTSLFRYLVDAGVITPGLTKENIYLPKAEKFKLRRYLLDFPKNSQGRLTGDASHVVSYMPTGYERIKQFFPEAKLIFIMRDPVERAYSHYRYLYAQFSHFEQETFEQRVNEELDWLQTLSQSEHYDTNLIFEKTKDFTPPGIGPYGTYLCRSLYDVYIARAEEYQFDYHALSLEDLQKNFVEEFNAVVDFIGGNITTLPEPSVHNKSVLQAPMNEETRDRLTQFFKPFSHRLFERLGRSFDWPSAV